MVNAAGQPVRTLPATCSPSQGPYQFGNCRASHGDRLAISYQPASRYWPLQWTETAIFAALAQLTGGLDPNFTVNAWGGPSYAGAMACHYLDLFLLAVGAAWLIDRILRA
jgi:hypothetical protein